MRENYKKIFSDDKVDIIFISSPTNTHIRFIEEGIRYNKTIFCEKPLDLNINKIIETLKKLKLIIQKYSWDLTEDLIQAITLLKKGFR